MGDKLNWDVYFLAQAFLVSQKSIDPSTKHGAIWVSKNNKILSVGYNGPLQNVDDTKIPLTRNEKYYHIIHSESNCLLSYNGDGYQIEGSRMYITGRCCSGCLGMMIQKGIRKIIYANVSSKCLDEDDLNAQKLMLELKPSVKLIEFKEMDKIIKLLDSAINYISLKK